MRPTLQCVLATKMEQAPAESYTECLKHTQAQSHDPKRMLSGQHYLEFHYLDLSHPYVVKLQTQIYFTGRIFFSLKFVSDL